MAVGGYFEQRGYSPAERGKLYYGACIWARLMLAALATFAVWYRPIYGAMIVAIGAVIAIAVMMYRSANGVWWSRQAHITTAALVLASLPFIVTEHLPVGVIGLILAVDVGIGLATATIVKPFADKSVGQCPFQGTA